VERVLCASSDGEVAEAASYVSATRVSRLSDSSARILKVVCAERQAQGGGEGKVTFARIFLLRWCLKHADPRSAALTRHVSAGETR
jgi:hypothetical protein